MSEAKPILRPLDRPMDLALFRRLLDQSYQLYQTQILSRRRKWDSVLAQDLRTFCYRASCNMVDLARLGVAIPEGLLSPYQTPPEVFDRCRTPPKYRLRPYNLSRDLLRYALLAPELLDPKAERLDILELSPGACAAKELLAPLGHRLSFAEFLPEAGSVFAPLHAELGVTPLPFDGRQRPFPLPDKCADLVLCFQAFDAYGARQDYPAILTEIIRLARRKCIVIFNGLRPKIGDPAEIDAFKASFAGIEGLTWTLCPETFLLTLIWTAG